MSDYPVLITGASSDIGLSLITRIASEPDPPRILAHCHQNTTRVEELRDSLGLANLIPLQCDFQSAQAIEEMSEDVIKRFGVPQWFVHLPARKLLYERFSKFNSDHFEADLTIQLRSAIILLRRFLPGMAKLPAARVVFLLSSITRGVPPKYLSMYSIVKHAQLGLMRSLASEYGETAVTVNAVSPSMVETRFLDDIPDIIRQKSAEASPKHRNATPADVVNALEFLLSTRADYINGIELPVTGGGVY